MREKKFTEGPWTIQTSQVEESGIVVGSAEIYNIATVQLSLYSVVAAEQMEANASLISAARDLLEALENAATLLKTLCGNTDDVANAVIELSEGAIAKAYGETP